MIVTSAKLPVEGDRELADFNLNNVGSCRLKWLFAPTHPQYLAMDD